MLSKLLNFLGTFIMILVIVAAVPLVVPKVLGYQPYEVVTGSMEPAYPVGSVVYVEAAEPEEIEVGDVITFLMNAEPGIVNTHRVIGINPEERTFATQGDANELPDTNPVSYERMVGKVVYCIPHLGTLSEFVQSRDGKYTAFILFACTLILWFAADLLRKHKRRPDPYGK